MAPSYDPDRASSYDAQQHPEPTHRADEGRREQRTHAPPEPEQNHHECPLAPGRRLIHFGSIARRAERDDRLMYIGGESWGGTECHSPRLRHRHHATADLLFGNEFSTDV